MTVAFAAGRIDSTAPLKATWSASDVPSGVASYQVQVSIGGRAYKTIYSGTATSVTKFYPLNKKLVFRVRALDTVGNWSAWKTSPVRKLTAYQNSSTKVVYRGDWHRVLQAASSGAGTSSQPASPRTETRHGVAEAEIL